MLRKVAAILLAGGFALPAFAQPAEIVCDDFLGMDNAAQMESIAEIQTMMSEQQLGGEAMTAEAIHERLTADCKSRPDALVVEVLKE
jgi:hypothetical protein